MGRAHRKLISPQHSAARAADAAAELAAVRGELANARCELETLYAALDHLRGGVLLLDKDLRAIYSNPALHTIFEHFSPELIRKTNPPYAMLLQDAATESFVQIKDYVARRLAWVRSGSDVPMDLPMTRGAVLRCHVAVLPNGGRMLIYSDVTDIVRNAEEMERLATIDGMTGIFNRRHFLVLAEREWNKARRYGRAIAFLMIDIDNFKAINDTFGHEVGDRMIKHLADLARGCKRNSDVLARIGGEEFALLLPETTLAKAKIVAERLRQRVIQNPLPDVPAPFNASVSIGVAGADEGMSGISDLMRVADHALYEAKRTGRNRVVCSISRQGAPSIQPHIVAEKVACKAPATVAHPDRAKKAASDL
jgi:diguanylate cyclase (GGDEF)-like protein